MRTKDIKKTLDLQRSILERYEAMFLSASLTSHDGANFINAVASLRILKRVYEWRKRNK